jgi:hypothetical protein
MYPKTVIAQALRSQNLGSIIHVNEYSIMKSGRGFSVTKNSERVREYKPKYLLNLVNDLYYNHVSSKVTKIPSDDKFNYPLYQCGRCGNKHHKYDEARNCNHLFSECFNYS